MTDSLWIIDRRDNSGAHTGAYWGNFVPQIPRQMMLRYTRVGEWVLDPFVGSGTTLIECRRLGRNGLGVEIDAAVSAKAMSALSAEDHVRKRRGRRSSRQTVDRRTSARCSGSVARQALSLPSSTLLIMT